MLKPPSSASWLPAPPPKMDAFSSLMTRLQLWLQLRLSQLELFLAPAKFQEKAWEHGLICFDYFVHILCVPLHANAHALDGWNSSLEKSGPTRWRPQLLLRLLLRLCQFFLALSQLCSSGALPFLCGFNCLLLLALCIPPQQAGLGNQGPGKQGPP